MHLASLADATSLPDGKLSKVRLCLGAYVEGPVFRSGASLCSLTTTRPSLRICYARLAFGFRTFAAFHISRLYHHVPILPASPTPMERVLPAPCISRSSPAEGLLLNM